MQTLIIHSDYVSRTFFNNENFSTLEDINFIKEEIKFDSFYRHKNMSYQESLSYNITAAIYFARKKHLLKDNYENIYKKFYEDFSDSIKINQYNINQHLMYSLNELDKIDFLLNKKNENINILEFGAGYGRTANAILSTKKKVKYIIVDIPPSLYVSTLQFRKHYPNWKQKYNTKKIIEELIDNIN